MRVKKMLQNDLLKAMSKITEFGPDRNEHAVNQLINSHPSSIEMIYFPQVVNQLCNETNEIGEPIQPGRKQEPSNHAQLAGLKNIYLTYIKETFNGENYDILLQGDLTLAQEYKTTWDKTVAVKLSEITLNDLHDLHIALHNQLSKAAASKVDTKEKDIPLEIILTQLQGNSGQRISIPNPCKLNFTEFVSQLSSNSPLLIEVSKWMKTTQPQNKVLGSSVEVDRRDALLIIGTVILANYSPISVSKLLHGEISNELYKRYVLLMTPDAQSEIIHWFMLHLCSVNINLIDEVKDILKQGLERKIQSEPEIEKQFDIFDRLKVAVQNEITRESTSYTNITTITETRLGLLGTKECEGLINLLAAGIKDTQSFCIQEGLDEPELIGKLNIVSTLTSSFKKEIINADIRSIRAIWDRYRGPICDSLSGIRIKETTMVVNIARIDPHSRFKSSIERKKRGLLEIFNHMQQDIESILRTLSKIENIYSNSKASHQEYCAVLSLFSHHNTKKVDQLGQNQVDELIKSQSALREQLDETTRLLKEKDKIIQKQQQKLRGLTVIIKEERAKFEKMEGKALKPLQESATTQQTSNPAASNAQVI